MPSLTDIFNKNLTKEEIKLLKEKKESYNYKLMLRVIIIG